jgi:Zn finger protein HypA/HybF involved in hydrogenase expression
MPNRRLTSAELVNANKLLAVIRKRLEALCLGSKHLLFAYRRKISKELSYDERGTPLARRKLKLQKRKVQKGRCAMCDKKMPKSGAILDRFRAAAGYTPKNTQLICPKCDTATQKSRRYA